MAGNERDELRQSIQALVLKGYKLDEIETMLTQREAQQADKRAKLEASNARLGKVISREEAASGPSLTDELGQVDETIGRGLGEVATYAGAAAGDVLDTLSGGGYRRLRDAAVGVVSPSAVEATRAAERRAQDTPVLSLPDVNVPLPFTDAKLNLGGTSRVGDFTRAAGNFIPAGLPGKAMQAGRNVAAAVGTGSAARRIAGQTAGGAAAGLTQTGTEALIDGVANGGSGIDWAKYTGAGTVAGAAFGGGAAALGEGAGAARARLRDERSMVGGFADHLNALDQAGAQGKVEQVGPLRRVVDPEMKALPAGKKGYAVAGRNARDKIVDAGHTELRQARANYGREIDEIAAAAGDHKVSQEAIVNRLGEMRAENQVNGVSVDDALGAALDKVSKMMTAKTGHLDEFGKEIAVPAASFKEILRVKKGVERLAEFGMPVTAENRPYREIHKMFADEAEALDPTGRLARLNAEYAETMGKLESANDVLFGKEAPEVSSRASARRAATNKLMRAGDDTTSGTANDEFLEELAALDPEYRQAIDTVRQKKAIEATRFGLTQISKSPERWGVAGLIDQNLGAATARLVDPALGAGEAFGRRLREPTARALRFDSKPDARASDLLADGVPVTAANPIIEARRKEREKDAERARKLRR